MKLNEMYSNKHKIQHAPAGYVFLKEFHVLGYTEQERSLYWLIRTEPPALSNANDIAAHILVEKDDRIIGIKLSSDTIWP